MRELRRANDQSRVAFTRSLQAFKTCDEARVFRTTLVFDRLGLDSKPVTGTPCGTSLLEADEPGRKKQRPEAR